MCLKYGIEEKSYTYVILMAFANLLPTFCYAYEPFTLSKGLESSFSKFTN